MSSESFQVLDFQKLQWLCEQRGIEVEESGKAKFQSGSNTAIDIGIPTLTRLLSHFAVCLAKDIPEASRPFDFRGAILWIGEYGIWDSDSENSAKLMFESMRAGRETLEEARGQMYRPDEWTQFHAAFEVILIAGWDALVILDETDYLIMLSHDDYVRLLFRADALADEVRSYVTNPKALMFQQPPWKTAKF